MHVMYNIITFKLHATELLRCMVHLYWDTSIRVAVNTASTRGHRCWYFTPIICKQLTRNHLLTLLLLFGDSMTSDIYKHTEKYNV